MAKKMKILFIAHRIPYPPNKGDKIRSYHELAALAERHTVWLACLADQAEDLGHVKT
ncbi:MAG: glycosyl transferase (group I), partial [Nitrospiraceae bacterium]